MASDHFAIFLALMNVCRSRSILPILYEENMPTLKRTFSTLLVVVVVLSCSRSTMRAQEAVPDSTYKAETTLVVVDTIVTDKKGKVVTGLDASAFKLYEDGVEQKIVDFSPPDQAADSGAAPALPAGRPAIAQRGNTAGLPHSITVVLDLADSRPLNIKRSCDTVLEYLRKIGNNQTQVAIYYVDYGLHLALPFTTDRAEAQRALEELQSRGAKGRLSGTERRTIQGEIDDLYARAHPEAVRGVVPSGTDPDPGSRSAPGEPFAAAYMREIDTLRTYLSIQNTYSARDTLAALRSIALSYRDLPGRKNVILFSEGFTYATGAVRAMESVIAAADLANVSFYVIDPSGLETNAGIDATSGASLNSQMNEVAMQGAGAHGGQTKFDRMQALGDRSTTEQLEQLATSTGGFLVKNTNDLAPAFSRILADTRSFYVMGYHPTNPKADGTFRAIRLQVAGGGLELRHRKGYWAIPRGRAVTITPAGAQLLASLTSGAVQSSTKPAVNASVML